MERRPRILVEAYECSPLRSHTAGSAWQIVTRLARKYDLWVVTEDTQYGDEVRDYLKAYPNLSEYLHFHFLPRLRKGGFGRRRPVIPIREVLEYRNWLKRSYSFAIDLHKKVGFDLAHHLRGDSFREPGYYWKLPIPFVWGPTGGTTVVPWSMMGSLDWRGRIAHASRNLVTAVQLRYIPRVINAARKAACLIAQTSTDKENFQRVYQLEPIIAHEQASQPLTGSVHFFDGSRDLKVAWIGRCIVSKAMPLLLNAISMWYLRDRVQVHIVGDGPYQAQWEKLAGRLSISGCCEWYGWLDNHRTHEVLDSCDVLVFTSVLEATATTIMDSLSYGVPVICLKHCGFGDIVNETCGIPIEVSNVHKVTFCFAEAIRSLIESPSRVAELSRGALARACEYNWDNLAKRIKESYEVVLSCSARRKA